MTTLIGSLLWDVLVENKITEELETNSPKIWKTLTEYLVSMEINLKVFEFYQVVCLLKPKARLPVMFWGRFV